MSSRSLFTRAADLVHKSAVVGLMSFFGYYVYQIGSKVYESKIDSPYLHSTYRQDVDERVKQEYAIDNVVDGRNERDWYATDDENRPRDEIRANITTPEFKKQYEQLAKK